MLARLLVFLGLNFSALALGLALSGDGARGDWYTQLNHAPWTPPGWFFGFAWTSIMICFAVYMAKLWPKVANKQKLVSLFALQWFFNISWNPAFFYFHEVVLGLIILIVLIGLVAALLFSYQAKLKWYTALIYPYFIWLLIASTLNGYVWLYN